MNAWLRRLLVILTIDGGFMGLFLALVVFGKLDKTILYFFLVAFTGLYAYGIFLGLKLSEGTVPLKQLRLYFGIQIPLITSSFITYHFFSGAQVTVAISQSGITFRPSLGSEWLFFILSQTPWSYGINLLALAIVILLYSRLGSNAGKSFATGPNHALQPTADRSDD